MKLKIAVSGAHSTGKTTFLKKVKNKLGDKVSSALVTDLASICPLPILKDHSIESSLWIAAKGITEELEKGNDCDVLFVDRSIVDCWAYFNYACRDRYPSNDPRLETLRTLVQNWIPTYDVIYLTEVNPKIEIEDNKGRLLDEKYRQDIAMEMKQAFSHFKAKNEPLTFDNSDVTLG